MKTSLQIPGAIEGFAPLLKRESAHALGVPVCVHAGFATEFKFHEVDDGFAHRGIRIGLPLVSFHSRTRITIMTKDTRRAPIPVYLAKHSAAYRADLAKTLAKAIKVHRGTSYINGAFEGVGQTDSGNVEVLRLMIRDLCGDKYLTADDWVRKHVPGAMNAFSKIEGNIVKYERAWLRALHRELLHPTPIYVWAVWDRSRN